MKCLDCGKFSLQNVPEAWKESGRGSCARHETFTLFDPMKNRECDYHEIAQVQIIKKRLAHLERVNCEIL